jgi:HEAT repeat protein
MRIAIRALLASVVSGLLSAQADLEALVDQLGSQDPKVRSQAYNELQRRRAPEMVPLLGKKIGSMPLTSQQQGIWLLQQHNGEPVKAVWRKLVDADTPYLRIAGAAHLHNLGDRTHIAVLAKGLQELPAEQRVQTISLLWNIDDERVLAAIRAWIQPGAQPEAIRQSLQYLGTVEKARNEATIQAAKSVLGDAHVGARAAALASLVAWGESGQSAPLAELIRATPDQLGPIRTILEKSAKLEPVLIEAIVDALQQARNKFEITLTGSLLQRSAPDKAIAALRPLLAHENQEIRTGALEALSAIPGALDAKMLAQMLTTGDTQQQLVAADTLRRMDDLTGLPRVIAVLSKDGAQKPEAARVLSKFRCKAAGAAMLDLLDDPDQQVRQAAWNGLQNLLRELFPYRKFEFTKCGYEPNSPSRSAGIAALRAFWTAATK